MSLSTMLLLTTNTDLQQHVSADDVTSDHRQTTPHFYWRCYFPSQIYNFLCIVQIRLLQFFSHWHSQLCYSTDAESPKYATRLILWAPRHQNCTPLLQQLHWFPISERIKYKTACMCYNAITGSAPSCLSELLHLYSPSRSLCSSSDTSMLKLQCFNHKTHGFHTFSHFGPHIWNNLPQDIRHSATLSSFKSQLKTFLFSEYFN